VDPGPHPHIPQAAPLSVVLPVYVHLNSIFTVNAKKSFNFSEKQKKRPEGRKKTRPEPGDNYWQKVSGGKTAYQK